MNENELYHYGVKGMKWGVRRWQNKDGTLTAAGKARAKGWNGDSNVGRNLQKYTSPTRQKIKNELVSFPLNFASMFVPGLGLAVAAKNVNDIRKSEFDGNHDYTKKEGQYENLSDLKKKSVKTSSEEDVKLANPRLGRQSGKINNCTLCTAAMELRNRGYDVIARSKGSGNINEIFSKWFKGAELGRIDTPRKSGESRKEWANRSYNAFCKLIEKQGPGASGYAGIRYEKISSGHAMWYKVGNDGKSNVL